jgi:uncharacterized protein (TIGR03435 family)
VPQQQRKSYLEVIFLLAAISAFGQTRPAFEVASVKPSRSGSLAIGNHFDAGRAAWSNVPLTVLIQNSYRVQGYQVIGLPAWADTDRWDIEAKTEAPANMAAKAEMMKALIEDRFHLGFHMETRQLPEFNLEIAKNGLKLQISPP